MVLKSCMHHLKLFACLLLAGTLIKTSHISAAPLKVLGLDDMSCVAWTKDINPELRKPYIYWVRGFLSGHNYANQSHQVAEVSSGTVEVYVKRYCEEHASATVADAAMRMSDEYSGRNSAITR